MHISFVNTFGTMILGAGLTYFFQTTMCNPPRLGSPPTGSASRLPPDLGAISSRPGQYPSSQKPNRCTALKPTSQNQGTNI